MTTSFNHPSLRNGPVPILTVRSSLVRAARIGTDLYEMHHLLVTKELSITKDHRYHDGLKLVLNAPVLAQSMVAKTRDEFIALLDCLIS